MSLPPFDQSIRDLERQYQVVLPDSVGQAALGFREGVWFRVNGSSPRPVPVRSAIMQCPHAAGSIVQITCWWMREYARTSRALDLATELALAVGELARKAIEDDPLGMSSDPLSTSQQNMLAGSLPVSLPPSNQGFDQSNQGFTSTGSSASYPAPSNSGSFAGMSSGMDGRTASPAGSGSFSAGPAASGGYASTSSSSSYTSGTYQSAQPSEDRYSSPYPSAAPVSSAATTMLPQIPADGYGPPPSSPRGPAIPPRGAMPGPGGSGGYPQRQQAPGGPGNGMPPGRAPQGGRYPQQGPGGGQPPRPPQQQQRRMPPGYPDEFRDEMNSRPPSRPSRPEPGNW